ncbi:MAG: DNA/RNA non-specific endonuclease [Gammaproteobacteria bacterium]
MATKQFKNSVTLLVWLTKLCFKDPLIAVAALALGGCWYTYEQKVARPVMAYQGVPAIQNWQQPKHWFRILRNPAFMVGYSDLRGNPLWVVYKIKAIDANASHYKRPRNFTRDWRTLNPVNHGDFRNSGYDRGHLAPNYAISRLYGRQAQYDTFLMSNISPQKPRLNQKLWQRLEQAEIDYFTRLGQEIWVVTGPIFQGSTERLQTAWNIEIPDAFYKIYALPGPSKAPKLLAFLIPQNVKGNEPFSRYLTTVDRIEQLTGLDFFPDLADPLENRLEATIDPGPWKLNKVAHLSARY